MAQFNRKNAMYQLIGSLIVLIMAAVLDKPLNGSLLGQGFVSILDIGGLIVLLASIYKLFKSKKASEATKLNPESK